MASKFGGIPVQQEIPQIKQAQSIKKSRFGGIPVEQSTESESTQQPRSRDTILQELSQVQPTGANMPKYTALVKELDELKELERQQKIESIDPQFREVAQEQTPGQAALIGIGKGITDIGRGLGIVKPADETEKKAISALNVAQPISKAAEVTTETAPFLAAGFGAGAIPGTAARIAATGAIGAGEGAIMAGADQKDRGKAAIMGGAIAGGLEAGVPILGKAVKAGGKYLSNYFRSIDSLSDDVASSVIAEHMIRDNIKPQQLIKKVQNLGEGAIPADASPALAVRLRQAMNEVPEIEGKAKAYLYKRQANQDNRIKDIVNSLGFDTLSPEKKLKYLDETMKPKVNELYNIARSKEYTPSPSVSKLLAGDNPITDAMNSKQVQQSLNAERALGKKIGNIDVIDETKKKLDDEIAKHFRNGEKNAARQKIALKNIMIEDADRAIPEYKQARELYAGKAALESAAETGEMFFKLSPSEIEDIVKNYSKNEKEFFISGVKESIYKKMNDAQVSADLTKRITGRRGDIQKLKTLFEDTGQYETFRKMIDKESNFILTKRIATANSNTAGQLQTIKNFQPSITNARAIIGDPTAAAETFRELSSALSGDKSQKIRQEALSKIADFLLADDVSATKVQNLLRLGSDKRILSELEKTLLRQTRTAAEVAAASQANKAQE